MKKGSRIEAGSGLRVQILPFHWQITVLGSEKVPECDTDCSLPTAFHLQAPAWRYQDKVPPVPSPIPSNPSQVYTLF